MTPFKKSLWILVGLLGLLVLFLALWIGINRWPRPIEPELWTEQDLFTSEDPKKNAWHQLPKAGQSSPIELAEMLEELNDPFLEVEISMDSPKEIQEFWENAKGYSTELAEFIKKYRNILEWYGRLLEYPQLIDQDSPLNYSTDRWFFLTDLHKIGEQYLVYLALEGDWSSFTEWWSKIYQQDLAWLKSAKSLISLVYALGALENDIRMLIPLRYKLPPGDWQIIYGKLKDFPIEQVTLKRALMFEYQVTLQRNKKLLENPAGLPWYERATLNRANIRRSLNQIFQRFNEMIENPEKHTEKYAEEIKQESTNAIRGNFWWFYNPAGKLMVNGLAQDMPDIIVKFYTEKKKMKQMIDHLVKPFQPIVFETKTIETP